MAILQGLNVTGSAHFTGSMFIPMVESMEGHNLSPGQLVFNKGDNEIYRGHSVCAYKRGVGVKVDRDWETCFL